MSFAYGGGDASPTYINVSVLSSSHSEREGEALRALLEEGATQAPEIERRR